MVCPKCNSESVQTSVIKKKTGMLWIGLILIIASMTSMLGVMGLLISVVTTVILLAMAPKHEIVGVCQSCGFAFNTKTGKEKKL